MERKEIVVGPFIRNKDQEQFALKFNKIADNVEKKFSVFKWRSGDKIKSDYSVSAIGDGIGINEKFYLVIDLFCDTIRFSKENRLKELIQSDPDDFKLVGDFGIEKKSKKEYKSKFTSEQTDTIVKLANEGKFIEEIADAVGFPVKSVEVNV